MEWQIPEPLSIRPCQKPSELKARQLNLYPVRLKKLPPWVDNATFQTSNQKREINQNVSANLKQPTCQSQLFSCLDAKYQKKQKFELIYQRGQEDYCFNPNFAYEYIPTDYSNLESLDQQIKQYKKQHLNGKQNPSNFQEIKSDLIFDSKFQCGNLSKVFKLKNQEQYHLLMQNDINTVGYTQWFAFSIKNCSFESKILNIRIANFVKSNSHYKKGMKPWKIEEGLSAWRQIQEQIIYRRTNVRNMDGQFYYQLTFSIQVSPGLTFLSMMPLYSYTRLCSKIQNWLLIKGMNLYSKKVFSLTNNIIPILEYIPHFENQMNQNEQKRFKEELKWCDTIVIFARTHPGEVWSSFLAEQFINTITHYHKSNFGKFRYLIFPMINPDGVIYGNFRCDFTGVDLNRVWINPSRITEPSIYNIKKVLVKELESKKAKYFIDFHSHSKSYNVFSYTSAETMLQSRIVSDLIRISNQNKIFDPVSNTNQLNKQFLSQSQTTYISSQQIHYSKKKSTARAFMSQLTEKGLSMTIQISFHGYEIKKNSEIVIKSFSLLDFNEFSWILLIKLHDYINLKEQVVLAKKMLQTIYNFYDYSYEKLNNFNRNILQKEIKAQQGRYIQDQDSDSQPERYYTYETKAKVKEKNIQQQSSKYIFSSVNKKGYLKQTQSMISKIQQVPREKSKDNLEKKYIRTEQLKSPQFLNPIEGKKQKSSKKFSFQQIILSKSQLQKSSIAQIDQKSYQIEEFNKNDQTFSLNQQKFLRNKIMIQTKKREFKFIKQDIKFSNGTDNKQLKNKIIQSSVNCISQPMVLIIDETKNYAPTFGKFMTTSKRNAVRRYKTVLKQQLVTCKNDYSKQHTSNLKENELRNIKIKSQISHFIQDEMEKDIVSKGRKQNNKQQDHKRFTPLNKELIKQEYSVQINAIKQGQYSFQRKNKKLSQNYKLQNPDNKFISQRKKIMEMMKKEARIFNDVKKQPFSLHHQRIEKIVQKRKRAKTQYQISKDHFQDHRIFLQNKLVAIKSKKPWNYAKIRIYKKIKKEGKFKEEYKYDVSYFYHQPKQNLKQKGYYFV